MAHKTTILNDVSLLYELTLAVGQSLDSKENCEHFFKILTTRKELAMASVWKEEESGFHIFYTYPLTQNTLKSIPPDHPIVHRLCQKTYYRVNEADAFFEEMIQEENISGGSYAFFRLEGFGFLKLYATRKEIFPESDLVELQNVIHKFALLLNGCMAYDELKAETDQKNQAQKALRISEERYRHVVHCLSEGIIITDLEGRITFVNEQMVNITGYSEKELLGEKAYELLIDEEQKIKILEGIEKRKKGISEQYEVVHRHKNGAKWVGSIKASPYRNEQGEIVGTLGAVMDVTEQHRAQELMAENEEILQQIINTSLDAIITVDAKGVITQWSPNAENIFGYQSAEAIGQLMSVLIIPSRFREAHEQGMRRIGQGGAARVLNQRLEMFAIDKTKREFPIELSITPIQLRQKRYYSAFIRDITARKKSENDLIKAKQSAEQARLAEQQFLANMSHEIRTPMNAVIGMTHLLYETNPSTHQKEYLDALQFSADSLMGIITNILDLSKIEAGALTFEKRAFDLKELITALQQSFQFKVKDKPVSVVMDVDVEIKHLIIGDSTRLNQILTNLLSNASKFTPQGTIGLSAHLLTKEKNNYHIEFQVYDTGIGISPDKIDLIFENFKQAEVGVTRKYGGTGLGLAIVKQLVELQGGQIRVESTVDKGARFIFDLKYEAADILGTALDFQEELFEDHQSILKDAKILVVEDNLMNQKLISKILDIWDCNYDIAENGLKAIECVKQQTYDIILMDVHMPEIDGCNTTIAIRAMEKNSNQKIPIIALTAAALLEEKKRAFNAGMNDFLTKPFSPKTLQRTLMKWLTMHRPMNKIIIKKEKTNSPSIDLTYLYNLSRNDHSFVKDMIIIFLDSIPEAITQMLACFEAERWRALHDIAHRIKSNYMMMGMSEQRKAAFQIEIYLKENTFDPAQIKLYLDQLKLDSEKIYPLLREQLVEEEKINTE